MKSKCDKCKSSCKKEGTLIHQFGEVVLLCAVCFSIFDRLPTGNLQLFLKDDADAHLASEVDRNILKARMNRSKGVSPWKKVRSPA